MKDLGTSPKEYLEVNDSKLEYECIALFNIQELFREVLPNTWSKN